MNEQIDQLRQELHALKLDMLLPADFTDQQCKAILLGRKDRKDPDFFTYMSGATVAIFKEAAKKEIMDWALQQNRMHNARVFENGTQYVFDVSIRFLEDMEKIQHVLFKRGCVSPGGTDIGLFVRELGGAHLLHQDQQGDHNPFYTARLGALPMLYVPGKDHERCDPIIRKVRRSRNKLLNINMLDKAVLGDVIMGFTSDERSPNRGGTWHCGSPVPSEGMHSAFFRAWTINWWNSSAPEL